MRASSTALGALLAALLAASCNARREPGAATSPAPARASLVSAPPASPSAAAAAAVLAAPRASYAAAQPWHAGMGKTQVIDPPAASDETWRVFVNQNRPIQLKTPRWKPLPAQDNVEPEMPEGSHFRCLVTPLEITTDANDFGTKLKAWVLTRSLRCSADGWRSWTEYPHKVRVTPDGTRTVVMAAEALLREREAAEAVAKGAPEVRETFVLVRDDEEQRAATTGPPRILPGVLVDED